jgi:hypothetical protein
MVHSTLLDREHDWIAGSGPSDLVGIVETAEERDNLGGIRL